MDVFGSRLRRWGGGAPSVSRVGMTTFPPVRRAKACCAFGMAVTLVGCAANVELDRKIDQVTRSLTDVEARGALRCAPRELAVARSQLEFARLERAQGFPARARYHIDIADENVRAAKVLSPPGRCSGAEGAPAVRSTEAPGDTDSP